MESQSLPQLPSNYLPAIQPPALWGIGSMLQLQAECCWPLIVEISRRAWEQTNLPRLQQQSQALAAEPECSLAGRAAGKKRRGGVGGPGWDQQDQGTLPRDEQGLSKHGKEGRR